MTLVIAHRGSSIDRPEQTRAAYELAVEQGADGLECDVRLTADGEVVCLHDATVDRTSNGSGAVHTLPLAELRTLDYSRQNPAHGRGELVTLRELIELARAAGRPIVLAIELKHPNPFGVDLEAAVLEVLDAAGWDAASATLDSVAVSLMSFNPASIAALSPRVSPEHLMLLTGDIALDDLAGEAPEEVGGAPGREIDTPAGSPADQLAAALELARTLIDDGLVGGVGPDLEIVRRDPYAVSGWIAAGQTVRVWTVDTAEDVELCLSLGVQEITTNDPALVRSVIDASPASAAGSAAPESAAPSMQRE